MNMYKNIVIVAICGIATMSMSALAAPIIYTGLDPGAILSSGHPNTIAARTSFLAGAATVGTVQSPTTFESQPLGYASTVNGNGFVASLSNQDPEYAGIRDITSTDTGYSTTAGGSKFLDFAPSLFSTGTISFAFTSPIDAFGADLTGVGTQMFPVTILFNNGKSQSYVIGGATNGGSSF